MIEELASEKPVMVIAGTCWIIIPFFSFFLLFSLILQSITRSYQLTNVQIEKYFLTQLFICIVSTIGNHDIEWNGTSDTTQLFKGFEKRYKMPAMKPAEFGLITHTEYSGCCPSAFQAEYHYGHLQCIFIIFTLLVLVVIVIVQNELKTQ